MVFLLLGSHALWSQSNVELVAGKVSFVTSQSIYVKFAETSIINLGDSLLISKDSGLSACLVVRQKSTSSCVCDVVNDCKLKKNDEVYFRYVKQVPKEEDIKETPEDTIVVSRKKRKILVNQERIRGRLSAATYSSFSGLSGDRHRMMYRFSLNAAHIKNSKFSFESYLNYRQIFLPPEKVGTRQTKFFRVYNLAVRYDVDSTLSVVVGRKINNKASSLGAIDGLQAEKIFNKKNYVGIIAGFRPDIYEYSFNSKLFQYGVYLGRKTDAQNIYTQTTLGFLEQRNAGSVDRRYLYFQHSSTFFRKLNLFLSAEMDVYNKVNEVISSDPRLTNLYVSARYRLKKWINFSVSYDTRKRILYYETFKTEIEQLLDDDLARQGVRFRVNIKPIKYVNVGASFGKRFQSNHQNKSDNINAFASLSRIPGIGGRLSVNFNLNASNYVESQIISVRHSRTLIKNKLNAGFYFRMANYKYLSSELKNDLKYYGTSLSYRINRKLTFSVLGEMAAKQTENSYRVNAKLIKRFDSKKRKKRNN